MASFSIHLSDCGDDGVEVTVMAQEGVDFERESDNESPAQRITRLVLEFIQEEMGEDYEVFEQS